MDTLSVSISASAPNQGPSASFTVNPNTGEAPLTVSVDATGSSDTDGTIASYAWDFSGGDIDSGTGQSTLKFSDNFETGGGSYKDPPWTKEGATVAISEEIDVITDPAHDSYDVVVIAVGHREFKRMGEKGVREFGKSDALVYDIKYLLPADGSDDRL